MKVTNYKANSISFKFLDRENRLELTLYFNESRTPFEMQSILQNKYANFKLLRRISPIFCDIEINFDNESITMEKVYIEPIEIEKIPNPLHEGAVIQLNYVEIIKGVPSIIETRRDSSHSEPEGLTTIFTSFEIFTP